MRKQERAREIERLWPRLREEAHELYREVGTLRGRVRQLEREAAASEPALEKLRDQNARLTASLNDARARLRSIEGSKGWRVIMKIRRLRHRRVPAPEQAEAAASVPPPSATARPEPTFAQLRAAEAMRRAEVAGELSSWIESARAAHGDIVLLVSGERSDPKTEALIRSAAAVGDPVCLLEGDPEPGIGAIPPGIKPTLVPDLLAMDAGGKEKLLVCTGAGHASIRWVVPAQLKGWPVALVADGRESPAAFAYLVSVADAVVVQDDAAARAVEAVAGVRATVRRDPSPRALLDTARAGWAPVARAVLGIG